MKTIRETNQKVIDALLQHADLCDNMQILEPSAGFGNLADGIKRKCPNIVVDCVELNEHNKKILIQKGHNVVGRDFFHFKTEKKYRHIIAAPNFKDNVDVDHIMKMYTHLDNGGRIISLTSPYWMTGNSERQVNFRKWLEDKDYKIQMLQDNLFMEDGLTVPTCIIVIRKNIRTEFENWYSNNERRFHCSQYDEKQIAYSAYLNK